MSFRLKKKNIYIYIYRNNAICSNTVGCKPKEVRKGRQKLYGVTYRYNLKIDTNELFTKLKEKNNLAISSKLTTLKTNLAILIEKHWWMRNE